MTAQLALDFADPVSGWRCARCDRAPGQPLRWLWRTEARGTALVDCPCGHRWQEPGWQYVDDQWIDTYLTP